MNIRQILSAAAFVAALVLPSCSPVGEETISLRIIHTTDVHGNLLPTDDINERPATGGMARLYTLMQEIRGSEPNVLLLDAGDFLQGEPITYYSNYVDKPHIVADAMNLLGYDAATIGNHDIEPGHEVYDRFVERAKFPVLAANAIREINGEPYFEPYKVFERGGARIAVVGFITPAIPQWLPHKLWEGMHFDDIVESARVWIPQVQKVEKPDLIIAMIHSGLKNDNDQYLENAGQILAEAVPGIDIILMGHDHRQSNLWVKRGETDSVLLINPANHLDFVGDIRVTLHKSKGGVRKSIVAELTPLEGIEPSEDYLRHFSPKELADYHAFLSRRVGLLQTPVVAMDALWGGSDYMAVIHQMQLATLRADISFAAPLALSTSQPSGDVYVRDLFRFCPFTNFLYVMRLTGREILGYLEHSYAGWATEMTSSDDHLIRFRPDAKPTDRYKTEVPTFNYSSAYGIDYVVDVSKPRGQRVHILQLSGGEAFDLDREYRVVINSYRAGGAGGMLTEGAGIPKAELSGRIVEASDTDQLMSLMRYIEREAIIAPKNGRNWHFVPTAWVEAARPRDEAFILGK
ncbi:MAG: 5'-nucleotidase C-terminal domain-containing protein [Porphyromonadaceae bacterium]|nr:5'-nucleotidase C-terminal domain-containing protein [Porphyromonadaceae bacterium]